MRVPNRELIPIIRADALSRGTCVRLTVSGGSMWPFIPDGAAVVIEPYDGAEVRLGDIALAQRPDGDCVLHRVARIGSGGIYLLGDAQDSLEGPFASDQIMGRATTVHYRGRAVALQHPQWHAAGLAWLFLRPLRRGLLRLGKWAWRGLRPGYGHRLLPGLADRRGGFRGRPEAALLLCCARVHLDDDAARRVRDLGRSPVNWALLIQLAQHHGLVPLLSRHLESIAPDRVPAPVRDLLRAEYRVNAGRSLALLAEVMRLLAALDAEGIAAIPLKGPVFAATTYGEVALRESSDADLLVRPGDLVHAERVLMAHGYEPEQRVELTEAQERAFLALCHHVRLVGSDPRTIVELHWRPASPAFLSHLSHPDLWERCHTTSIAGQETRVPAAEDLLLLLCLHGYKHLFNCLKWICDIAEVIRSCPDMNYERLRQEASRLGCLRAVLVGHLLAGDLLQAPVPPPLLAEARMDRAAPLLAAEIERRIYTARPPRPGPAASIRDLLCYLRATDRLGDRVRFCLRWLLPGRRADIARLPLPASLRSVYWLVGPVSFVQRKGAAARSALSRSAPRPDGR